MDAKIEQRLQSLREEYKSGQNLLKEYQQKQRNLEQTLLRISGAVQVLEELIAEDTKEKPSASQQMEEKE